MKRGIQDYVSLWTTDWHQFVLVPLIFPNGDTYYDLYHRDGTYQDVPDPELGAEIVRRMLAAGTQVMTPDEWIHFRQIMAYEPYWTTRKQDFILVRYEGSDSCESYDLYERNGRWQRFDPPHIREEVIERMRAAGVECLTNEQWTSIRSALEAEEREREFQRHSPMWTTEQHAHLLVAHECSSGGYYRITRRDGFEYRFCDDQLARCIAAQMLAAGIEVVDSETWEKMWIEICHKLSPIPYSGI